MSNKLYALLICLALTLAIPAVFWQVRNHEFVDFDDDKYIYDNDHVKAGLTRQGLIYAFTGSAVGHWQPLTILSLMLDCELYGLEPGGHHLTSVLFHIANTLLLFLVLNAMTGNLWSSAFVATAFALHPLRVESVAWASERKDVLSTFFFMMTMAAYLHYVKRPGINRYLLILTAFVLGLMAKAMLVTVPFVLLLLDYWPLGRFRAGRVTGSTEQTKGNLVNTGFQQQNLYRLVWEKVPFLIISAIISIVIFLVHRSSGWMKSAVEYTLLYRIENALVVYVTYIAKMFWPVRLAVFYPHPLGGLPIWKVLGSASLLVFITVLVIWKMREYRYLVVGWLWYLGTLVPVIGLVQVGQQAMHDHFTYIPLTGLFIIVGWGVPDLLCRLHYRRIIVSISAVLLLFGLGIVSWFQVRHWRSSFTLYRHAAEVVKDNWWAHLRLGFILNQKGKVNEAVNEWKKVVQLRRHTPSDSISAAHFFLGSAALKQDRYDDAVKHFNESLRGISDLAEVHYYLGLAYALQGNFDEAIKHYTEALRLKPDDVDTMNNLAWVLATAEDVKFRNPAEAVKLAERACELTGYGQPDLLDTLAVAYAADGRFDQAIKTAEIAIKLAEWLGQRQLAEDLKEHLQLFQSGRVYIEKQSAQDSIKP